MAYVDSDAPDLTILWQEQIVFYLERDDIGE